MGDAELLDWVATLIAGLVVAGIFLPAYFFPHTRYANKVTMWVERRHVRYLNLGGKAGVLALGLCGIGVAIVGVVLAFK